MESASAHRSIFQTSDFIAYSTILIAALLEYLFPTSFNVNRILEYSIGIILLLIAWSVILLAKYQFKKCNQPSRPGIVTTDLVTSGIFAYSRNPMYVGIIMIVIAVGVLADSLWVFGSAIVVLLLIQQILILPEEKYLQERFSTIYTSYAARVRRWL